MKSRKDLENEIERLRYICKIANVPQIIVDYWDLRTPIVPDASDLQWIADSIGNIIDHKK